MRSDFPRVEEALGASPLLSRTKEGETLTISSYISKGCELWACKKRKWYTTSRLLCKKGFLINEVTIYGHGEARLLTNDRL